MLGFRMAMMGIFFGLVFFGCGLAVVPEVSAIELDDLDDLDRQDVEDYIENARKAADRENFSEADEYVEKAAKYGIEKAELEKARQYISKKRQERAARLAAERKAEEERRAAAARAGQASGTSSSGGSSSGACNKRASMHFASDGGTVLGTCAGSRKIQITSLPTGVFVSQNSDNFIDIYRVGDACIRGNYSFTYSAKAGAGCDKYVSYSGTFWLSGKSDYYKIVISDNRIDVYGN